MFKNPLKGLLSPLIRLTENVQLGWARWGFTLIYNATEFLLNQCTPQVLTTDPSHISKKNPWQLVNLWLKAVGSLLIWWVLIVVIVVFSLLLLMLLLALFAVRLLLVLSLNVLMFLRTKLLPEVIKLGTSTYRFFYRKKD